MAWVGFMADQEFDSSIEAGRGGGTFVAIPFDVKELFGTSGQGRVIAHFDGIEAKTALVPMGGQHVLGLRKSVRETLGKQVGDPVHVTLRRDLAPRTFEMPPEFAEALAQDPDASEFFDSLSFTHRREMAASVREAKRQETKQRRLEKAMTLLQNQRRPV